MLYKVIKHLHNFNGYQLTVVQHSDEHYIATLSKTEKDEVAIKSHWKYEGKSYQAVMVWVNETIVSPIKHKYFESGFSFLPHNEGLGNITGKRLTHTQN